MKTNYEQIKRENQSLRDMIERINNKALLLSEELIKIRKESNDLIAQNEEFRGKETSSKLDIFNRGGGTNLYFVRSLHCAFCCQDV